MSIKIDFICYAIYNSSSAIKRSQAAEFRGTYPHHPNQPNHSKSTFKLQIVCILIEKCRVDDSPPRITDRPKEVEKGHGTMLRFGSVWFCFTVLAGSCCLHTSTTTRMQFAALLCNKNNTQPTNISCALMCDIWEMGSGLSNSSFHLSGAYTYYFVSLQGIC